jgi:hypothetical protein
MYDLKGAAWRTKAGIGVELFGMLPNTCQRARIADKYPGGNIVHITDPGHAEVFIEEWTIEPRNFCLEVLVPWTGSVSIPTQDYDTVEIYVNGSEAITLKIQEDVKAMADLLPWKVIALTGISGDPKPPYFGCAIIPSRAVFPAIYTEVLGPSSRQACDEFVKKNCHGVLK